MKTSPTLVRSACVLVIATSLAAAGCKKKETPATPAAAPSAPVTPATAQPAAPATSPMSSAAAVTDAAKQRAGEVDAVVKEAVPAAAATAGETADTLKTQAAQLLAQYSGELATLKSDVANAKALIDKNVAMLPAGVAAKYQELNALLPKLTSAVDALKNYQTADFATLVPKLKTDFATAQKLYTEIKGMLPAL